MSETTEAYRRYECSSTLDDFLLSWHSISKIYLSGFIVNYRLGTILTGNNDWDYHSHVSETICTQAVPSSGFAPC